jgi:hypothetical protein
MNMENIVVIVVLVLIIGLAVTWIIREKKKGIKCVGCPNAQTCSMAQKQKCNGMCDSENK